MCENVRWSTDEAHPPMLLVQPEYAEYEGEGESEREGGRGGGCCMRAFSDEVEIIDYRL